MVYIHFPSMWAVKPHPQRPPPAAAPSGNFAKAAWEAKLFVSYP